MMQTLDSALQLRRDGDLPGAIRVLYDALAANLADVTVVTTLATMLSESEQFDRADRVFQRAFAAGVQDPALHLNYATFLAHSGRVAEAAPMFRRASADVIKRLQHRLTDRDDPDLRAHLRQMAVADCNLARVRLIQGDLQGTRDLADRWLVFESAWEKASELVSGCLAEEAIDAEMLKLHTERRASPDMVADLADAARERGDLFEALAIAAEACGYLAFEWLAALAGFDAVLAAVVVEVEERVEAGEVADDVRGHLAVVRQLLGEK